MDKTHDIPFLNQLSDTDIFKKLSNVLPDYIVPTTFIAMESFPLTNNGKLDKHSLPDPDFYSSEQYLAPTTQTEADICIICQPLLGLQKVSLTDDFFKIGGNSIYR